MNMASRKQDILKCLPLLASILGSRYGVKVEIGGGMAYTDGNVIHIPALPLDCDTEMIALARGFTDHESAHIRYTDFNELWKSGMDKTEKFFWNAIEDWRVERKLAEIYPGCRQNFNWLIRNYLIKEKEKEKTTQNPVTYVLNYVLFFMRSLDAPDMSVHRDEIRASLHTLMPGLVEQFDTILNQVGKHCPDTKCAIVYAKELADCLYKWHDDRNGGQSNLSNPSNPSNPVTQFDQSDDHNLFSDEKPETEFSFKNSEEIQGNKQQNTGEKRLCGGYPTEPLLDQPESFKEQENSESGIPIESNDEHKTIGSKETTTLKEDIKDQLERIFDSNSEERPRNLGEILADSLSEIGKNYSTNKLDVAVEGTMRVNRLAPSEKSEAMRSSVALRQRLQGFLQTKTSRGCATGRRGTLNPQKLYRLNVGNPRVFQRESISQGINTAVHILLDCSGSMKGERILLARQACFALARCLENIRGVNVAVTAFPGSSLMTSVYPIVRHGERVNDQFDMTPEGSTPLAESLWWVLQNMSQLRENRKIVFIITDGSPDDEEASIRAIQNLNDFGIEVYGIGVCLSSIQTLLPEKSRVIYQLNELAPAMFIMLQDALFKERTL